MPGRSIATVLFTDIVGSTEKAAALGDRRWREVLHRHHVLVREQLGRFGGKEIATAGDGFLAVFESPARAIVCAASVRDGVKEIGLEVRCGVHMGEVERSEGEVSGIAVHIGARVAAHARPGEVLVSATVREAERGSDFEFEDRGRHELKGVPGEMRLYALSGLPDDLLEFRDIGDVRIEIEEAPGATIPSGGAVAPERASADRVKAARRSRLAWWAAAGAGLLVIGSAAAWQLHRSEYFWRNPLEGAKVTRLTDFEGAELHAAISPDGKFVAFLSDRDGTWDAWVSQIGAGDFHNLTKGRVRELRNPATRTVGFSPDGSLVILWSRVPDSARGGKVDAGWAVPTMGGPLRPYLEGIAEVDWSPDGRRIVYHSAAPGDPMFVTELDEMVGRQIYVAPPGLHNHFPVWSHDGAFIYFVHGLPLDESDVWRIRPTGGELERLTSHESRVTFPTLLGNRTLLYLAIDNDGSGPWIYAIDVERRVSHRISTGAEEYTSLAASADGRRLVATVSRSTAGLWRVPIADRVIDESGATPISIPTARGLSPRAGRGYIIYRAPKGGTDGLVKLLDGGTSTVLWSGLDGRALGGPAISPDGQRLAFLVQRRGLTHLYVTDADGSGARRVAEELDVRGAPAWSPDGQWLAVAADRDGEPRLFKIPLGGGTPVLLVKEYSIDPIWDPSGQFLVYSGADVGTTFSVKAVNADGTPRQLPNMFLTRGARRLAFLDGEDALVTLKGDVSNKEFWLVDLKTGRERQLTNLGRGFAIGDFDVSADGREIIFDRAREESDIVLFDLPVR